MSERQFLIMKCGCAKEVGNLVCTLHNETQIMRDGPERKARLAKCMYCAKTESSRRTLAFFRYHPDRIMDEYYCGCYGWD